MSVMGAAAPGIGIISGLEGLVTSYKDFVETFSCYQNCLLLGTVMDARAVTPISIHWHKS